MSRALLLKQLAKKKYRLSSSLYYSALFAVLGVGIAAISASFNGNVRPRQIELIMTIGAGYCKGVGGLCFFRTEKMPNWPSFVCAIFILLLAWW